MAWRSLHSVHDEEKPFELEVSWVCDESEGEFRRVPADLVAEATAAAKAALADSDMWAPRTGLLPCPCLHVLCPLPTIRSLYCCVSVSWYPTQLSSKSLSDAAHRDD